jgi:hypothetical protein
LINHPHELSSSHLNRTGLEEFIEAGFERFHGETVSNNNLKDFPLVSAAGF